MWVIKPRIGRVLGVFRHSVAHSLTGRQPRRGRDGLLVYPPPGRRDGGSGTSGGGELCLPPPKHVRTFHCEQDHYVPVSGGGAYTGSNFIQAVVVIVQGGCGIYADGVSGGIIDGGGEDTDGTETKTD